MENNSSFVFYFILLQIFTCNALHNQKNIDDLLTKSGIRKTNFHISAIHNGNLHVTNLDDNARAMPLFFKGVQTNLIHNDWQRLYRLQRAQGKLQKPRLLKDFPCNVNGTTSAVPPTSVHRVRPGDVDIIAAIGDSLSAGVGILSDSIINLVAEFRSLAFTGGGAADWRTVLTLPNILKVFNPHLYGYAIADVDTSDKKSKLNIAESMLMSSDMVFQVHVLIQRMQNDPRVDMKNHWKLLTMFVGTNDICFDMCHYDNTFDFLKRHEQDLRNVLKVLRDNVPRLLVNLISPPNYALIFKNDYPISCRIYHSLICHCLSGAQNDKTYLKNAEQLNESFRNIDERIAALPEFQTEDFAVLYQPIFGSSEVPKTANGEVDLRYLSIDCSHYSQLGHAYAAKILWNNMLQMPGEKEALQEKPRELFDNFECPSEKRPYIATLGNSHK